jgi:hypothetical protein
MADDVSRACPPVQWLAARRRVVTGAEGHAEIRCAQSDLGRGPHGIHDRPPRIDRPGVPERPDPGQGESFHVVERRVVGHEPRDIA